jgi:DNA repair exonuclease SbcCD nuclease subunit
MKFLLLSDLHISNKNPIGRLDDLAAVQYNKLQFIFDYAKKNDCVILQAGDFFDAPRSYYVLSEMIAFLKKYSDVEIFSIFGQHDTYMYSEETKQATNLGVLEKSGYIKILNKKAYVWDCNESGFWHVYGCSWGQKIPKVKMKEDFNILVIHASVAEKALWHGYDYLNAEKFLEDNENYDIILCGDIHRKFLIERKGRYILNTGPLVRRSADEYNFSHKPCFYVYDTNCNEKKEIIIPHKSAEEILSRNHIEREKEIEIMLDDFISSIKEDFEGSVNLSDNMRKYLEKNPISQEVKNIIARIISEKG